MVGVENGVVYKKKCNGLVYQKKRWKIDMWNKIYTNRNLEYIYILIIITPYEILDKYHLI